MEELSGQLEGDIDETREDWEPKKKTEAVPGALDDSGEKESEDERLRGRRGGRGPPGDRGGQAVDGRRLGR